MLQRSLTTPTATEIAGSLQQTLERSALRSLQNTLQLPETWQQYLIMLGVVLLIGAGITTHMLITVQIAEAQSTVRALRAEYEWIQFQNSALIHEIATRTSLSEMQSRAAELGYIPATSRTFVYRSAAPALGPAATITTLPDADAPTVIVQPGPPTPAAFPPATEAVTAAPPSWREAAQTWLAQQVTDLVATVTGQRGSHGSLASP
jgi:hypothetical protein